MKFSIEYLLMFSIIDLVTITEVISNEKLKFL